MCYHQTVHPPPPSSVFCTLSAMKKAIMAEIEIEIHFSPTPFLITLLSGQEQNSTTNGFCLTSTSSFYLPRNRFYLVNVP
jgi:hypothetical protein